MERTDGNSTWDVALRWLIRVLTLVGVIDALAFMRDGGPDPNPVLILLTAFGVIGAALAWLSTRLPGKDWAWLSIGALMNAVAPAVFYPANAVLAIAGLAVLGVGVARLGKTTQAA